MNLSSHYALLNIQFTRDYEIGVYKQVEDLFSLKQAVKLNTIRQCSGDQSPVTKSSCLL